MKVTAFNDWYACDLSDLIAVIESGQRPYGGVTEESGEIPSLGGENIRQDGGVTLHVLKKVPTDFYRSMTKGVLQPQDVLLNKDGANTGKIGIYGGEFSIATINEHLFLLRGKPDRLVQRFLYRILVSEHGQRTIRAKISGSAQPGLKSDFIRHFPVFIPNSTAEQSRIAAVLDTLDEAIAKTEAVIAKLKQVRAGLLHDLLTRGLDEHGQLRDPIAHPEQFKDSLLGRIPREWEAKELRDCYAIPSRNGLYKKAGYYGSGNRMVHMPQMFKDVTVDVSDAVRVEVEPHELQRYSLEAGDLLFARRSLNLEGAGLCSIVPSLDESTTFESSIIRVRLEKTKMVARFTAEFLRSECGYLLRRPFIRQVAVSGVSSEDVGHFLVPCPPLDEQSRILILFELYDRSVSSHQNELRKLTYLKSALMSDLLTGRVRVPADIFKENP